MNPEKAASEQYADVVFIPTTQITPDDGYVISEAFRWSDTENDMTPEAQLSGYWMSKYVLSAATAPVLDADIGVRNDSITISNMRQTTTDSLKYEYYLSGVKKGENTTGEFEYTGLAQGSHYTVNIIARNQSTNAYYGAITKEITLIGANPPDLTGFNPDCTYYLTYDGGGNEVRTPITGSPPQNWYDYATKKWANIVVTGNGKEAYFVWIPRYAYMPLYNDVGASSAYADIIWLPGTSQDVPPGYVMSEAFRWSDTEGDTSEGAQLTGYWMSKYLLSP